MVVKTIQSYIDDIKLPLEDPSLHPQRAIALPNILVYRFLLMSKNAVLFTDQETSLRKGIRNFIDMFLLDCVEMYEVDLNECPCTPPTGCTWMRSTKFLPEFLGENLSKVTLHGDGGDGIKFQYISWSDLPLYLGSRKSFISNTNIYTIKNRSGKKSLYTLHGKGVKTKYVSAEGPFTNPLELFSYVTCKEEPVCGFLDQEFYVDPKYQEAVVQRTINILATALNISRVTDVKDDDKDASQSINQN